jgi:pimeloyl-ACP methyl ester carboxylesterase
MDMRASINCLPVPLRYRCVRWLASRPARPTASEVERSACLEGRAVKLGTQGRVPARMWGEGPTIAVVHGWGGAAVQWAPFAARVADQGFRVVAFDVAGHGASNGREARWEWFIRDIAEVARELSPLSAFVGHSAGALSMMASRGLANVKADKYVCVCPPFFPYPPIRGIRERLNPGEAVLDRYRSFLAMQFNTSWSALEQGAAWQGAGSETFVCHDQRDRFVEATDGDKVKSLRPDVITRTTSGYGHLRILAASELVNVVTEFLRA